MIRLIMAIVVAISVNNFALASHSDGVEINSMDRTYFLVSHRYHTMRNGSAGLMLTWQRLDTCDFDIIIGTGRRPCFYTTEKIAVNIPGLVRTGDQLIYTNANSESIVCANIRMHTNWRGRSITRYYPTGNCGIKKVMTRRKTTVKFYAR